MGSNLEIGASKTGIPNRIHNLNLVCPPVQSGVDMIHFSDPSTCGVHFWHLQTVQNPSLALGPGPRRYLALPSRAVESAGFGDLVGAFWAEPGIRSCSLTEICVLFPVGLPPPAPPRSREVRMATTPPGGAGGGNPTTRKTTKTTNTQPRIVGFQERCTA